MSKDVDKNSLAEDDIPPIFNSWNKLYGFVFSTLVVLVILFYLFTKAFE
ncbi:MAG: hypothetical protein OQJ78_06695 [Ignavibacteriaceae bacterium]|jgi:hypothetical protein|nr:hypothetical protein [Ignavibacteriaceae bacterium]